VTLDLGAASIDRAFGGTGADVLNGSLASERVVIYGGAGDDAVTGSSYNDDLRGDAGDRISGSGGNDTLNGGAGNDTYVFGRGGQSDIIVNNDAVSTNDRLEFESGIGADQLWFERAGNNLRISIMGTTDRIDVQNWYLGGSNQIDAFQAGDGKVLTAGNVEQLRSAMAAFTPPPAFQSELNFSQHQALDSVLAASCKLEAVT
jgi:Ca2+-binding RTX toxin-like protein